MAILQGVLPYNKARVITKSDTVNFAVEDGPCDGIYVGTTGAIVVVFENEMTATFVGNVAGSILPVKAKRVNSTNTTASNMLALYYL